MIEEDSKIEESSEPSESLEIIEAPREILKNVGQADIPAPRGILKNAGQVGIPAPRGILANSSLANILEKKMEPSKQE